ncbi:hypothetical protein HA402_002276 [Bradysia odoriphaga]|nr:hypothetical protein HA402_002276 [Bradysia odoriphaga]
MKKELCEKLERLLFTTTDPNDVIHRCVIVFHKMYAISFYHGHHNLLKNNDKLLLYNVKEEGLAVEVAVHSISKKHDLIIFKVVNGEFRDYPQASDMYAGQKYYLIGLQQKRRPMWKNGIISQYCDGYYVGTSHSEIGGSGSGIFNEDGQFIGIAVAKKGI